MKVNAIMPILFFDLAYSAHPSLIKKASATEGTKKPSNSKISFKIKFENMNAEGLNSLNNLRFFAYKIYKLFCFIDKKYEKSENNSYKKTHNKILNTIKKLKKMNSVFFDRLHKNIIEINGILINEITKGAADSNNKSIDKIPKLLESISSRLNLFHYLKKRFAECFKSLTKEFDEFAEYVNSENKENQMISDFFHKSLVDKMKDLIRKYAEKHGSNAAIKYDNVEKLFPSFFQEYENEYFIKLEYFRTIISILFNNKIREFFKKYGHIFQNESISFYILCNKFRPMHDFLNKRPGYFRILTDYYEFDFGEFTKLFVFLKSKFQQCFENEKSLFKNYLLRLEKKCNKITKRPVPSLSHALSKNNNTKRPNINKI